jgi:hypothetical protein
MSEAHAASTRGTQRGARTTLAAMQRATIKARMGVSVGIYLILLGEIVIGLKAIERAGGRTGEKGRGNESARKPGHNVPSITYDTGVGRKMWSLMERLSRIYCRRG